MRVYWTTLKFLNPAVQEYVFVDQINFIFLSTENVTYTFYDFGMLHTNEN